MKCYQQICDISERAPYWNNDLSRIERNVDKLEKLIKEIGASTQELSLKHWISTRGVLTTIKERIDQSVPFPQHIPTAIQNLFPQSSLAVRLDALIKNIDFWSAAHLERNTLEWVRVLESPWWSQLTPEKKAYCRRMTLCFACITLEKWIQRIIQNAVITPEIMLFLKYFPELRTKLLEAVPLEHPMASQTLSELIRFYQQYGLLHKSERKTPFLVKVCLTISNLRSRKKGADEASAKALSNVLLELLQISTTADIQASLQFPGFKKMITDSFSQAIIPLLPPSPTADLVKAMELFKCWRSVNDHSSRYDAIEKALSDLISDTLSEYETCGHFLFSLGQLRPLVFEIDFFIHKSVGQRKSPLIEWMKLNDPKGFEAAMMMQDASGQTALHYAIQAEAWEFIRSLSPHILHASMHKPDIVGASPIMYLKSMAHHSAAGHAVPSDIVHRFFG